MEESDSALETDSEMRTTEVELRAVDNKEEILEFKVYKDEGKPRPEKKTFEELIKEKKIQPIVRAFNFVMSHKISEEYDSYDLAQFEIKRFI